MRYDAIEMGGSSSFYVRTDATGLERLRVAVARHHQVSLDDGCAFAEIKGEERVPLALLARLSSSFDTDVIWLAFQSVVDAFEYRHWRRGECVRELVYGCFESEREWEIVSGEPQPWEADALWEEGNLSESVDSRETACAVAEHFRFSGWG